MGNDTKKYGRGCIIIAILAASCLVAGGWLLLDQGSPLNRASAVASTKEWARLADLPSTKTDLVITPSGSMFTRGFEVSFQDTPQNIAVWLAACPGPSSVTPQKDMQGWMVYSYPAGGGAVFAEVKVSPAGDEVEIKTYWS